MNLFEKLVVREGEVACLLARSYFGMSTPSRYAPPSETDALISQTRK